MFSYPLEREFPWRRFHFFALGGGFMALVVIIVVNVALTGHETVTVFRSDYRVRQTHWYDRFRVVAKEPASLCDTRVFNTGDSLTTNYTIFAWTLRSIILPNAGNSGLAYKGTALTDCDISSLFLSGDLRSWTVEFSILISCSKSQQYNVTATTWFSTSYLPGSYSPPLGIVRSYETGGQGESRAMVIDWLIQNANVDLGRRVQTAFLNSGGTNYLAISLAVNFHHCPVSLGREALCGINTPSYTIEEKALVYPNATLSHYVASDPPGAANQANLDPDISGPLNNIIRIIHAAARIDLGIDSPNNFILHPEVSNASLMTTFPITDLNPTNDTSSSVLLGWVTDPQAPDVQANMPVNVSGPAEVQVVYLCRLQQWKPAGELFISVLVATLIMFSSGWAIFIAVATFIAKRQDEGGEANICKGHCGQWHQNSGVVNSSNPSDSRRRFGQKVEDEHVKTEPVGVEPIKSTEDNGRTASG